MPENIVRTNCSFSAEALSVMRALCQALRVKSRSALLERLVFEKAAKLRKGSR
jgi:hypothetical protein